MSAKTKLLGGLIWLSIVVVCILLIREPARTALLEMFAVMLVALTIGTALMLAIERWVLKV